MLISTIVAPRQKRRAGLFSVPKRFGIATALLIARFMHIGVVALLAWLAAGFALPWPAWLGIAVVAALLAYDYRHIGDDVKVAAAVSSPVDGMIDESRRACPSSP